MIRTLRELTLSVFLLAAGHSNGYEATDIPMPDETIPPPARPLYNVPTQEEILEIQRFLEAQTQNFRKNFDTVIDPQMQDYKDELADIKKELQTAKGEDKKALEIMQQMWRNLIEDYTESVNTIRDNVIQDLTQIAQNPEAYAINQIEKSNNPDFVTLSPDYGNFFMEEHEIDTPQIMLKTSKNVTIGYDKDADAWLCYDYSLTGQLYEKNPEHFNNKTPGSNFKITFASDLCIKIDSINFSHQDDPQHVQTSPLLRL